MEFKLRIILDLFIVLSIAFCPWWLTLVLIILGLFFIEKFYEAFLFAFVIDSLYGVSREIFWKKPYVFFLIILILFFSIDWIKRRLRI